MGYFLFNTTKKTIFAICFIFFTLTIHANTTLTDNENALISTISDFRLSLEQYENPLDSIQAIAEYKKTLITTESYQNTSDEIKLVIDNFFSQEQYNYLTKIDNKSKQLKEIMIAQLNKNTLWFENHPNDVHNKWLYLVAADTISCCIQYFPLTQALSDGLIVKKYYEAALEQDPEMSMCLMNLALWYFYAPAIGGGSSDKALLHFKKAVKYAKNNQEKFFSEIQLSQMLFELGKKLESKEHLEKANKIYPKNQTVTLMKKLNSNGLSYFYYTLNRMKIDKKGILK